MLQFLHDHLSDILTAVTSIVTAASVIANMTPSDADNKIVAAIAKFVDMLALNFKK